MIPLPLWPGAFDIGENCPYLSIAQAARKSGHVTLVTASDHRRSAFLDDPEQDLIGMMPGVAAFIMRRGGKPPGRQARTPVGLSLQVRTVANRAFFRIDQTALFHHLCGSGVLGSSADKTPSRKPGKGQTCKEQAEPQGTAEFGRHGLHWCRRFNGQAMTVSCQTCDIGGNGHSRERTLVFPHVRTCCRPACRTCHHRHDDGGAGACGAHGAGPGSCHACRRPDARRGQRGNTL